MPPAIFISYRRKDAGGHAGRLKDRLAQWFDEDVVFYDVGSIDTGEVFPQRLADGVAGSVAVLVVIGPDWQKTLGERAAQPEVDWVRHELELALARNASGDAPRILPILVGGAQPPARGGLPEALRSLADLNARELGGSESDYNHQFRGLLDLLEKLNGVPTARFRSPSGVAQPFRVIEHQPSPHFQDPLRALDAVHAALRAPGFHGRVALHGMGGIGKTQLALRYSLDARQDYAGVWWFRAEQPDTLDLDCSACLQTVGAAVPHGQTPAVALRQWFEAQSAAWLLVCDNAESVDAVRPLLPAAGRHHVLITSRSPSWSGIAKPLLVEIWQPAQALGFLTSRLDGAAAEDLEGLARCLGGLPLALEQAAAFLEDSKMHAGEYCKALANVDDVGGYLDEGRPATGYERSVLATLSVAFPQLPPEAAQLLRLCAFLAPDPIPERLFVKHVDLLPEPLSARAKGLAWEKTVAALRRYALADRVAVASLDPEAKEDETEQALVLHRLTQEVARTRLAEPAQDASAASSLLRRNFPGDVTEPSNWPLCAALIPHLMRLESGLARGWCQLDVVIWLLERGATFLRNGPASYAASRRMFETAVGICRGSLGEEHPETLTMVDGLANTLREQGERKAARLMQEETLEVQRRVLGEEHPDTVRSMNNLAASLLDEEKFAEGRQLLERVVAVLRRTEGEESPDTLTAASNLAQAMLEEGDLKGARGLQEQVLATRKRVLGDEHPDTLSSLNNLAGTMADAGDDEDARKLQEQVLEASRRVLGVEHPDTLTAMNNLALTLNRERKFEEARKLHEHALDGRRRVNGEQHPDTIESMNSLADTLVSMENAPAATRLLEKVLEARRRSLGEDHPDTLASMNNLAATLFAQGLRPEARSLQEQVVAGRRKVMGDDDEETLLAVSNLVAVLRELDDQVAIDRLCADFPTAEGCRGSGGGE